LCASVGYYSGEALGNAGKYLQLNSLSNASKLYNIRPQRCKKRQITHSILLHFPDLSVHAVYGEGMSPLDYWDRGFESG